MTIAMLKIHSNVRRSCSTIILVAFLLSVCSSPAVAYDPATQATKIKSINVPKKDPSLGELLGELLKKIMTELHAKIKNKKQFARRVFKFKRQTDRKLPGILERFAKLINDYAENKGGLGKSERDFVMAIDQYSNQLWDMLNMFPRIHFLQKIVKPILDDFFNMIGRRLPGIRTAHHNKNPMAKHINFYEDMHRKNLYETGSLYYVEPPSSGTRSKTFVNKSQQTAKGSNQNENVIFRQLKKFKDNQLVFHKLIRDNVLVRRFKKRDDLSVYHGMPEQMKKDGVNENVIRMVEEMLNLMNYHLVKSHKEKGLIIDIDHPQLKYPNGYNPKKFVRRFTKLLKNWQKGAQQTLKSWEQKIRVKIWAGQVLSAN